MINKILKKIMPVSSKDCASKLPVAPMPSSKNIKIAKDNYRCEFDLDIDKQDIEQLKNKLSAYFWHYPFKFNPDIYLESGVESATGLYGRHYQRYVHIFSQLLEIFGSSLEGKNILDCACNCGFWSIQSLSNGAKHITAFDASEGNIEQAEMLKNIIGLKNIDYKVLDVAQISKESLGTFDITFFLGILYHLHNPIDALLRLKEVTNGLVVIDTNTCISDQPVLKIVSDDVHAQNHSNKIAYYPSPLAVYKMLELTGFTDIKYLPLATDMPDIYTKNLRYTFIAYS